MADVQDKKPINPLHTAVDEMRVTIGQLVSQVSREHDRAQAREGVIDRLHEELQRFRAGERRELLRPVVALILERCGVVPIRPALAARFGPRDEPSEQAG